MKSVNLQKLMLSRIPTTDGSWDAGMVYTNLYVGSLNAAQDVASLRSHNIKTVLTIANGLVLALPEDINHVVIEIPDHPIADILGIIEQTTSHIDGVLSKHDSINVGVLVHCASGISRSVSVCCAWLMFRKSLSFVDSLEQIRTNRPLANPNIGFQAQLTTLSRVLAEKTGCLKSDIIAIAQREYMEQLGGQTIMDALFQQRETANQLHAQVDALEISIKQEPDLRSLKIELLETWRTSLSEILQRAEAVECQYSEKWIADNSEDTDAKAVVFIQDKPAGVIRRAAIAKAARLLCDLEPQKDM